MGEVRFEVSNFGFIRAFKLVAEVRTFNPNFGHPVKKNNLFAAQKHTVIFLCSKLQIGTIT